MPRSKFVWLIIFEDGKTQFFKAQTLWQIINSDHLLDDMDCIMNVTKMGLADSYSYEDAVDIRFED